MTHALAEVREALEGSQILIERLYLKHYGIKIRFADIPTWVKNREALALLATHERTPEELIAAVEAKKYEKIGEADGHNAGINDAITVIRQFYGSASVANGERRDTSFVSTAGENPAAPASRAGLPGSELSAPECSIGLTDAECQKEGETPAKEHEVPAPDSFRQDLIEAISCYQGWEESAVTMVDECILPVLRGERQRNPAVDEWAAIRGLPMSEIKVGMKLRSTSRSMPIITVTEITEKGFKYTHPRHSLGPRHGWGEGGECYGHDGWSFYEEVGEA